MRYAVIAGVIVCWTILAFTYKFAARRNAAPNVLGAAAGLVWLSLVVGFSFGSHVNPLNAPMSLYLAGVLCGLAITAALPLFMATVARGNLAISWTILTLSFAAVSLASLWYPGATASKAGVVGLVAAAIAVVLLGADGIASGSSSGRKKGWGFFMTLSFITNGLSMYVMALADKWGDIEPASHKMAFFVALTAILSAGNLVYCRVRPGSGSKSAAITYGALLGLMFFGGNYGVMLALGEYGVPAYLLFPATAGGSTITVALTSALFGDKLGPWGWAGLALGVAALILLGGSA
jgi:hypothetical protein